jgi:arabinogalactan oligomer / maltooligosaccharide transport system permease protein
VSSSTVVSEVPRASVSTRALSLPARAMSFFSGSVGLGIKLAFLAIVNAIALWAAVVLAGDEKWIALVVVLLATAAIDAVYLVPRRTLPLKFIVPGTVFLLAFQVIPIFYNANVAFTNWSTGHLLTKTEAIDAIKQNSLEAPADARSFSMAPARDADGNLVLILVDEDSGDAFAGTTEGLTPLSADAVSTDAGAITAAEGYTLIKGPELLALDRELNATVVPTEGSRAIRPEGLDLATEQQPTLRYVESRDVFVSISDRKVYRDNGEGSFVAADGTELEPGWRTHVGLANFSSIANDPLIREPFVSVFIWTFAFAILTVLLSFAFGLFLAIALNKPGMRFLRTYRALLILPYAVPAFLTILVWGGLLNDEFGLVNRLLPVDVPWLFDANWAKVSVLIVSIWLTAPYFFLISLGALQAIPEELVEAARVDGGGPLQIFRRVTFPLLLVAVTPLLIASFAFNFNNFNIIYLLTKGGPAVGEQSIAGGTDILISYTWKLAFESGKGQNYGLASAISIVIFAIVAFISAVSFWRSKSLENLR